MAARKSRLVRLPYGSGPFYTALVKMGAVFCFDCKQYVWPGHFPCDPDGILRTQAQGVTLAGGPVTLDGGLDMQEINAELVNAEEN